MLADDCGRRVVVIDTSNEICGDGDVPHPALGRARRMMVPHPEAQHRVMIEAVENHMPEAREAAGLVGGRKGRAAVAARGSGLGGRQPFLPPPPPAPHAFPLFSHSAGHCD